MASTKSSSGIKILGLDYSVIYNKLTKDDKVEVIKTLCSNMDAYYCTESAIDLAKSESIKAAVLKRTSKENMENFLDNLKAEKGQRNSSGEKALIIRILDKVVEENQAQATKCISSIKDINKMQLTEEGKKVLNDLKNDIITVEKQQGEREETQQREVDEDFTEDELNSIVGRKNFTLKRYKSGLLNNETEVASEDEEDFRPISNIGQS